MAITINTSNIHLPNADDRMFYTPWDSCGSVYVSSGGTQTSYSYSLYNNVGSLIVAKQILFVASFTSNPGSTFTETFGTIQASTNSSFYISSVRIGGGDTTTHTATPTTNLFTSSTGYMQATGTRYVLLTRTSPSSSTMVYSVRAWMGYSSAAVPQRVISGYLSGTGAIQTLVHTCSGTFLSYYGAVRILA